MTPLLVHATGIAALALSLGGSLRRCDRGLHRANFLAGVLWALNNLLLGSITACALSCVSAARTGTASLVYQGDQRVRIAACALFSIASIATAIWTWQGWTTLLPVSASVLVTYAAFYLTGQRLRIALLVGAVLWIQNAVSVNSPEQIVGNLLAIGCGAIGIWRTRETA